jgi:hypothetical protein
MNETLTARGAESASISTDHRSRLADRILHIAVAANTPLTLFALLAARHR